MNIINIENLNYSELEITNIIDSKSETMDIQVDKEHYYQLNNGIFSHNTTSILTQTTSDMRSGACRNFADLFMGNTVDEHGF